jgi:hypothetical protein
MDKDWSQFLWDNTTRKTYYRKVIFENFNWIYRMWKGFIWQIMTLMFHTYLLKELGPS